MKTTAIEDSLAKRSITSIATIHAEHQPFDNLPVPLDEISCLTPAPYQGRPYIAQAIARKEGSQSDTGITLISPLAADISDPQTSSVFFPQDVGGLR